MEPSCDGTDPPEHQVALFLPYLNWDTFRNYKSLHAVYDCYESNRDVGGLPPPNTAREKLERAFVPNLVWEGLLHPRRTLDQFYYSSLSDTETRDADQTVSKWSGTEFDGDGSEGRAALEGRNAAVNDSLLIMVDQLWCWIVDGETVLSFFPSKDAQYTSDGFNDLYTSISKKANKCRNVYDFYALVAKKATNYFFNKTDRTFADLVEIYRWVVSKKAASQTMCFEEFHQHYSNGNPSTIVLDDRTELKLVLQISDIIDELNMMQYLFKQQRDVLQSLIRQLRDHYPSRPQAAPVQNLQIQGVILNDHAVASFNIHHHADNLFEIESTTTLANGINGMAREHVISTDEKLLSLRAEIAAIISDAEKVRNMLLSLLDLKSKTASLLKARSSTKQGRAVMLFTIVTIIFLPLSFFTSYFGQNVSEITGDPKNPTSWHLWRIATPITIVVVAVAFVVAYYIGKPDSRVWGHGRRVDDAER